MKERIFNICDKARVKRYNSEADFSEIGKRNRARYMPSLLGHIVVIVDCSDGHGLAYGVVKPNFDGYRGRTDELHICWLDPSELDQITGEVL